MSDTPTYASLTPLTPTNPMAINGLTDLQPVPLVQDQNTLGMISPSNGTVLSPAGTPQAVTEIKPEIGGDNVDKNTVFAILQFLRKNNLKETEDNLRRECGLLDDMDIKSGIPSEVSSVLSSYKTDGDPTEYEDSYQSLAAYVEKTLDTYKYEVAQVLYPVFVHMYLELVYNDHENMAVSFFVKFSNIQEDYFQDDILSLSLVTNRDHMNGFQIMDAFRSSQYRIRVARDAYTHLKRYIADCSGSPVARIIQERLSIDVYEGVPRSRIQVKSTAGALDGEAARHVNRTKIYYGLLKEPELQAILMEEEEEENEGDKPKKKKQKKDPLQKKNKNDPNAPPSNRVPLPELRDIDRIEKVKAYRDSTKKINLSRDNLPSICFYTMLNVKNNITSFCFSDDSSTLAYGTSGSTAHVHSITPTKLKPIKTVEQLEEIDKYADDVLVRMMDERSADQTKNLIGHNGPVYACSFSSDRTLLLTCSKDGSIRLWSLQTWTCLVTYKGHIYPVWDVKFCSSGYYFLSGGFDRTARLWATDHQQALRIFAGHHADVDVVEFHPNCNYVITGSSDRSIRVWDVVHHGNCVRVLTGHKAMINVLCVSPCGRYLASGGADNNVLVWDLSNGNLIAEMMSHIRPVYSVSFSRDSNILATGGLDNCIKLWDFGSILEEMQDEDSNGNAHIDIKTNDSLLINTFHTKNTPVLGMHFTRRNVLLAVGPYDG